MLFVDESAVSDRAVQYWFSGTYLSSTGSRGSAPEKQAAHSGGRSIPCFKSSRSRSSRSMCASSSSMFINASRRNSSSRSGMSGRQLAVGPVSSVRWDRLRISSSRAARSSRRRSSVSFILSDNAAVIQLATAPTGRSREPFTDSVGILSSVGAYCARSEVEYKCFLSTAPESSGSRREASRHHGNLRFPYDPVASASILL